MPPALDKTSPPSSVRLDRAGIVLHRSFHPTPAESAPRPDILLQPEIFFSARLPSYTVGRGLDDQSLHPAMIGFGIDGHGKAKALGAWRELPLQKRSADYLNKRYSGDSQTYLAVAQSLFESL